MVCLCHGGCGCTFGTGDGVPLAGPQLDESAACFPHGGGVDVGGDISGTCCGAPLAVPGGEGPLGEALRGGPDLGVHGTGPAAAAPDGEGVAVRLPCLAFTRVGGASGLGDPIPAAPEAVPGSTSLQLTDRFRFDSEPELGLMFTPVIHFS